MASNSDGSAGSNGNSPAPPSTQNQHHHHLNLVAGSRNFDVHKQVYENTGKDLVGARRKCDHPQSSLIPSMCVSIHVCYASCAAFASFDGEIWCNAARHKGRIIATVLINYSIHSLW